MAELAVLLVGDTKRAEFAEAGASLYRLGQVVAAADVDASERAVREGLIVPDLIVVAQAYPGQFPNHAIDRLRRWAPLARVLGLLGSWCEGEVRTGQPWPAVIRTYWHQWTPLWEQELARLKAGLPSAWGLPATASDEERLLATVEAPQPPGEGLVAISSPLFDMHDWLSAACRRRGYSTVWLRPHHGLRMEGVTAVIFDATDCGDRELTQVHRLTTLVSPAPIVALLDFPRHTDRDRVLAAGAAAMISKPFLIDDLFWQIDRCVRRAAADSVPD